MIFMGEPLEGNGISTTCPSTGELSPDFERTIQQYQAREGGRFFSEVHTAGLSSWNWNFHGESKGLRAS